MTLPIDSLHWIRLVADATTPPEWQQYGGRIVGVDAIPPTLGSGPDNLGSLLGLGGYPRASADPLTGTEFVLTRTDTITATFIAGLRPDGWTDPTQLQAVQDAAAQAIAAGTSAADVRTLLGATVQAVSVDVTAAIAAAPAPITPTPPTSPAV